MARLNHPMLNAIQALMVMAQNEKNALWLIDAYEILTKYKNQFSQETYQSLDRGIRELHSFLNAKSA
jgi:hypothetical protein